MSHSRGFNRFLTLTLLGAIWAVTFVPVDANAQEEVVDDGIPTLVVTNRPVSEAVDGPVYQTPNRAPLIGPRAVLNEEYFAPIDTLASRKIVEIREELFSLQSTVADLSEQLADKERIGQDLAANYYANVATISTQLQSGTTPGNPRLIERMALAQESLETLAANVADLNTIAIQIADSASVAAFLQEAARASYALSGAVEEDHARLAQLEDSIANTITIVERLLNNVNDDITRASAYLASERSNLRTMTLAIANGDLYGRSLSNRPFSKVSPSGLMAGSSVHSSSSIADDMGMGMGIGMEPVAGMPMGMGGIAAPVLRRPANPRPLVVIRFDDPNVEYQQAVYMAVNEAIERYPDAQFELVAVNPAQGNAAKVAIETTRARRNAEKVLRSLTQMGLTSDRIILSSLANDQIDNNEVHIYIR